MDDVVLQGRAASAPIMSFALQRALQSWDGLLELLPVGICTCDHDGILVQYNRRAAELWGRAPVPGDRQVRFCGAAKAFSPDGTPLAPVDAPMSRVLRTGELVRDQEFIIERPDGSRITILANTDPLFDQDGNIVGGVNCFQDIADRKRAEAQQKALIDELNHRVKNTLATVQSLAAQSLREVPRDVRETFEERLLALSRTHDQLSRAGWESADLGSILDDLVAPYRDKAGNRIRLEGGPVKLTPQTAVILAMVLHELTTNAAKYGALSVPGGSLAVAWSVVGSGASRKLRIDWQESGGPVVKEPARRGFGSRLVERAVSHQMKGSAHIQFEPAGVSCRMDMPLSLAHGA